MPRTLALAASLCLARYLLRPPLSDDRLTLRDDGKVALALKTPWRDGTVALVMTPEQLVARLHLLAVARNLTSDDATGQMLYGIEFLAPAPDAEIALECFAATLPAR